MVISRRLQTWLLLQAGTGGCRFAVIFCNFLLHTKDDKERSHHQLIPFTSLPLDLYSVPLSGSTSAYSLPLLVLLSLFGHRARRSECPAEYRGHMYVHLSNVHVSLRLFVHLLTPEPLGCPSQSLWTGRGMDR